jgi:hypothetical protein
LRYADVIAEWASIKDNVVDFIIVPSNTSKVLPFIYRLHKIYHEIENPPLKVIYANVGEYGGSEVFSYENISKIEKDFQHNCRDNVGEVIVKRIIYLKKNLKQN